MTLTVSQSKVKSWRQCKARYHHKYVEGLTKKRINRPFRFGNIVHSCLEAHANCDDWEEVLDQISLDNAKLFRAEKEVYGNIIEDIRIILKEYFNYWDEDSLVPIRHGKLFCEHPFELEVKKGIIIKGRIDEVAKTPNKLRWMTEHKTFKRLPNEDHRWRNLQSVVYLRAIEMMGWYPNLAGTCWNYIRSKAPTTPKLTKTGQVSQAKIDTLPSVIKQFLRENDLKAKEYPKLIENAESSRDKYFIRVFTPVTKSVVDLVFKDFIDTAEEIAEYHGIKSDMNVDRHCEFCDYEPICRAKLTGSDVDFVISREYIKETKGEAEDEANNEEDENESEA